MLSCREATRLLSDSLDRRLPFGRRVRLRIHVLICVACRRYARHIALLNDLVIARLRDEPDQAAPPGFTLSKDARRRIQETLDQFPQS
jgi:predicted anti-sigma-YlaC factor YlaD